MPETLKKIDYCKKYEVICPYIDPDLKDSICLADKNNCKKWRRLVKGMNKELQESEGINLIDKLLEQDEGKNED